MAMPSWPTPGDQREDHATAAGSAIGEIYAQAEQVIIAAIATVASKVAAGAMLPSMAMRHVRATVDAVLSHAAPRARRVLDDAMTGASSQVRDMITPALPSPAAFPLPDASTATGPLAALLDQATDVAAQSAEDQLTAITAAAAQVTEEPAAIGARLALPPPDNPYTAALGKAFGHFGGYPGQSLSYRRIQAAQVMLNELADHGITGFTDRAGRNWDIASYAEMATRTAVSNAWDDMQAGFAVRAGLDLVETGTHSTEGSCPLCIPWLGRTLSLTGATPGYPTVDEAKAAGWRHPNCRCFWHAIGDGFAIDVTNPVPIGEAAEAYKASQHQRLLERRVRAAGRAYQSAITPRAKTRARRDLAAARATALAHRQQHALRIMQVTTKRREAPYGPR